MVTQRGSRVDPPLPIAVAPAMGAMRRQAGRVDPLAEHRRQLARQPVSPELAIVVRASGYRGEIPSALWALEWLGFLAGHRAEAIDRGRAEGGRGQ